MSSRAHLSQQFGNALSACATFKKTALAAVLAASVAVVAFPANATIITGGGNCGTGALSTTGTTTSQLIIGCVATGSLEVNASSAGNGLTTGTAGYTGGSIGLVSGYFTGSNGSVLVNGNGTAGSATLNISRAVEVGFSGGSGSLTVQNGGTAQVTTSGSEITIANSNSTGTATVDGANSLLSSGARLYVGSFSNAVGTLTVSNGGKVQSTVAPGGFSDGAIVIGAGSNASGTVTRHRREFDAFHKRDHCG
ncbi:MAG TPA: hypothetical protein VNH44_14175 [Micropepsaceae bacterium]|nr:hypothetical protein [Micropepsaceae bacterium]